MHMSLKLFLTSFFLLLSFCSWSQIEQDDSKEEGIETKIQGIHESHAAFAVIDIESGKIVHSHHPDQKMILASVSKVFSYFFALNVLGPEYRFETKLFYTGKIEKGVLKGDLILEGGGDPYLGAPHLLAMAHELKLKGINKVEGKFLVDGSALQEIESVSTLGLTDQPDNPSISGLNAEFNRYEIWSKKSLVYPPVDNLVINRVNRSAYGLRFGFDKIAENKEYWNQHLREYIPSIEAIPTKDSALYTGNYFKLLSERLGLSLPSPEKGKRGEKAKTLYIHKSIPLERLAELGLEFSNNLMAESILMTAAKKINTLPQDSKISARTMVEWYKKKFPEIKWDDIQLINGSGLTVFNLISAKNMALFMRAIYREKIGNRSFMSYLSINGHNGGIRRRLNHPQYAFKLFGKTGSLYFVNNLSGVLIGNSGKMYSYAFFTTHHNHRGILSGDDPKQKKFLRRKSGEWNNLSTNAMDALLSAWIEEL